MLCNGRSRWCFSCAGGGSQPLRQGSTGAKARLKPHPDVAGLKPCASTAVLTFAEKKRCESRALPQQSQCLQMTQVLPMRESPESGNKREYSRCSTNSCLQKMDDCGREQFLLRRTTSFCFREQPCFENSAALVSKTTCPSLENNVALLRKQRPLAVEAHGFSRAKTKLHVIRALAPVGAGQAHRWGSRTSTHILKVESTSLVAQG